MIFWGLKRVRKSLLRRYLILGIALLSVGTTIISTNADVFKNFHIEGTGAEVTVGKLDDADCTLTIRIEGKGKVIVKTTEEVKVISSETVLEYKNGTNVRLYYRSGDKYQFNLWKGDVPLYAKYNYSFDITMDRNKELTANFTEEEFKNCLGTFSIEWQGEEILGPCYVLSPKWRKDKHYFFGKVSKDSTLAEGFFTAVCKARIRVLGPGPRRLLDRHADFVIHLLDPGNGTVKERDELCFTVYETTTNWATRILFLDNFQFEIKPDWITNEGIPDDDGYMKIRVYFRGKGWLFSPSLKGWSNPFSDTIYIHFLDPEE